MGMIETVPYLNNKFEQYSEKSNIFIPNGKQIETISKQNAQEIYNILGYDERLFDTFLNIIKHGGASLSENIGNDFEIESELKILEVDRKDLIKRLELFEFEKTFDGEIDDVYLDFLETPDMMLSKNKATIRIRFKNYENKNGEQELKMLCTLKKRILSNNDTEAQDLEFRECYEKEFIIHDLRYVLYQLDSLKLYPYRQKQKQRISYITRKKGTKFDLDNYKDIPSLLEIESSRKVEEIIYFMEALGVANNETSAKGSRGTFKDYGINYDYIQQAKK